MFKRWFDAVKLVRGPALSSIATSLGNSLLSAAALLLVARTGRYADLGAYAVGTVGASIVATILAVGTTTMFMPATTLERASIATYRATIAGPLLIVTSVALGLIYSSKGYPILGVVACAAAVALNNLAEVIYSSLLAHFRFSDAAIVSVGSKGAVVAAVLVRVHLPAAILLGSVLQLMALLLLDWHRVASAFEATTDAVRLHVYWRSMRKVIRIGSPLLLYNSADYAANRLDVLVLSIFVSPRLVGQYSIVYSVFSAIMILSYSFLSVGQPYRVRLILRAGVEPGRDRSTVRVLDMCALLIAAGGALILIAGSVELTHWLGLPRSFVSVFFILGLSLVPFIHNRRRALGQIAIRNYAGAARLIGGIAVAGGGALAALVPFFGPAGAAAADLAQELLGALIRPKSFSNAPREDYRQGPLGGS